MNNEAFWNDFWSRDSDARKRLLKNVAISQAIEIASMTMFLGGVVIGTLMIAGGNKVAKKYGLQL